MLVKHITMKITFKHIITKIALNQMITKIRWRLARYDNYYVRIIHVLVDSDMACYIGDEHVMGG